MTIKQMLADQAARKEALDAAEAAMFHLKVAYAEGSRQLTNAVAEASGYSVGKVIKSSRGDEMKINYFLLTDSKELFANCSKRIKDGWAKKGLLVRLNLKKEMAA